MNYQTSDMPHEWDVTMQDFFKVIKNDETKRRQTGLLCWCHLRILNNEDKSKMNATLFTHRSCQITFHKEAKKETSFSHPRFYKCTHFHTPPSSIPFSPVYVFYPTVHLFPPDSHACIWIFRRFWNWNTIILARVFNAVSKIDLFWIFFLFASRWTSWYFLRPSETACGVLIKTH